MRFSLAFCLVVVTLGSASRMHAAEGAIGDVVEEQVDLPVTIHGKSYALDTLIVRPATNGRYPLALIAHEASGPQLHPRGLRPRGLLTFAHDLAHRGWTAAIVMWRGYGTSSGDVMDEAGTCKAPQVGRYLSDHADDLQAAMESLTLRQGVDSAKKALVLGLSVGGASALALAGRTTAPQIGGVINVSGGLYHNAQPFRPNPACDLFYEDLVIGMGRKGADAAKMQYQHSGSMRPTIPGSHRGWLNACSRPIEPLLALLNWSCSRHSRTMGIRSCCANAVGGY